MVTRGHLLALKILASDEKNRPRDSEDIRWLLDRANPLDIGQARQALDLITARGFHRQKDLASELNRHLSNARAFKQDGS